MRLFLPLLVALLTLAAYSSPVVAAAGIRGPPASVLDVMFEPGATNTFPFEVSGSDRLHTFLDGDLTAYATIIDPQQDGGSRSINVVLHFPNRIPAGDHFLYVGVSELPPPGASIGGIAAARRIIHVFVLYDDPLVVIEGFSVGNVPVNTSTTTAAVTVQSLTLRDLTVSADFFLRNANGTATLRVPSGEQLLPSNAKATLTAQLPTRSLLPGPYDALVVVHYAYNQTNATTTFRVGDMNVTLLTYPPNLTAGRTNRFVFTAQSNWVNPLEGYGIVDLGGLSEQTPTVTFPAITPTGIPIATELKTYLDLSNIPVGPQSGNITLVYRDNAANDVVENRRIFPITVMVVNETVPGTEAEQHPSALLAFLKQPIVYVSFALLLVILSLLFWRRTRGAAQPAKPPTPR
jgi:hypothetical protein